MSSNFASNQKIRLKQVPIDVWSIREKLCLASSVQRSGDQNWSTVSRSLKPFGEKNRPKDWFNQKHCALQYEDLIEMTEKEMPKRKRGERGEETAQDVIVRKLTKERIDELRKITAKEKEEIKSMKKDIEELLNNTMDEKRLKEIINQIKNEELAKKEVEIERKKWLEEREIKIAQMKASRGLLQANRQRNVIPVTPVKPSLPSSNTTSESLAKSPLNEPLKVSVESDSSTTTQTTENSLVNENKLTLPLPTPSTSPLLTSLLQSPTASTQTLLSPNKSGLSSATFIRQTPTVSSPSATAAPPITRRPSIHSTPEKIAAIDSPQKSESIVSESNDVTPVITDINSNLNSQQTNSQSSSSTLTKLLEIPESPVGEPAPVVEEEEEEHPLEQISPNNKTEECPEAEEVKELEDKVEEEIIAIKSPTILIKEESDETPEVIDELIEKSPQNTEQTDNSDNEITNKTLININDETQDDNQETETPIEDIIDESVKTVEIKREIIEPIPEEVEKEILENITIKEEPMDTTPKVTEEDSKPMSCVSTRAKRKKPMIPMSPSTTPNIKPLITPSTTPPTGTPTPTPTRRSGRVKALKDSKATTDDSTEVSDQSSNTPQAPKKRGSIDDTTETSMSEESMDAKASSTVPMNESLPNSPASSIMQTEDSESIREYKIWKKAIMLVWRTISTHKNASLFLHPVTESDAEGYTETVHRSTDLTTIKKQIETGIIRTTPEFQREIMLMFQNAIMFNNANHDVHKMAVEMQKETIASIEDFIETQQQNNKTSNESKLRGRERRSAANTSLISSPFNPENEISGRRKSRGASTDTDSNPTNQSKSVLKKKKP